MPRASFVIDRRLTEDAPSVRIVKRVTFVALAIHVALASYSGYRAIVQVRGLEVRASDPVLRSGSRVEAEVVSSGRTEVGVQLEVIQGARAETLGVQWVQRSREAAYDPRTRRGRLAVVLTPAHLAGFVTGPAVLRATGMGSPQWLRTPPPTIREMRVAVRP